jgi:hypothetical protein
VLCIAKLGSSVLEIGVYFAQPHSLGCALQIAWRLTDYLQGLSPPKLLYNNLDQRTAKGHNYQG